MNTKNNSNLTKNAQEMRKNMTQEERKLWYNFLKNLPYTVNRQKVIGSYILDFYIASKKLAIEIDGSQHFAADEKAKDNIRDNYLSQFGIKVLRYSNYDVNTSFDKVCEDIINNLNTL